MSIRRICRFIPAFALFALMPRANQAQTTNLPVRVMAANITSGTGQSYEAPGIRIFQGLKPDIVAIQEFQYQNSSTSNDLRTLVNTAFGTNFHFYCEPGYNIPNGIISRWPILNAGSWDDPRLSDRGFAWGRIDLPGSNDLYVVSVHLYNSGTAADRNNEAVAVKSNILASFPANAWVIVAGDLNTVDRTESAVATFKTFLSDSPIPTDAISGGDPDTNEPRSKPYDYVLPSFSLTNHLVPVVIGPHSFPDGLVFDSTDFAAGYSLANVAPVETNDSHVTGMQHMAVVKDFSIAINNTNPAPVAPVITAQPQSRTNTVGTTAEFLVAATGTAPLAYQWRFNGATLAGASAATYTIASVQSSNAGNYTVVITNIAGSVTSAIATLTVTLPVTNTPPLITVYPSSVTNMAGSSAIFSVTATGTAPLAYQWRFNGATLVGANAATYTIASIQSSNAGDYTVVITNIAGAVTSPPAFLTVTNPPPAVSGSNVVISQIYGGGGLSGASFQNDFVELFNPTAGSIGLNGWTLQHAGATGTSWSQTPLAGTIQPYAYYLVRLRSDGAIGGILPLADATNTGLNISSTSGKLALVRTNTALSGANPLPNSLVADFVGYGSTANAYEGDGPVSTISGNTNCILRKGGGHTDTDSNTNDFITVSPPTPRNSASPTNPPPSNPPALPPTLSGPTLLGNEFILQLTGTPGSNYIVQVSASMDAGGWQGLKTNAAPFWITNPVAGPGRFFRGMLAP